MVPPELDELTPCLYSSNLRIASEEMANEGIPQDQDGSAWNLAYLMKSVSRNWSRLTKDFMVRYRPKRS